MSGAIERIERDITALEEALATLAAEFQSTYSSYLTHLEQAVQQQMILASYYVCTQGYPEAFLQLSFSQRQQLQKALQRLGKQASERWSLYLKSESPIPEDPKEQQPESLETFTQNEENTGYPLSLEFKNPEQLAQWQEGLEKAIARTLESLSHTANRLLQQASIISPKVPEAVLEAAIKAETSGEGIPGPPNILNLLMEVENPEESESSTVTQILAINLRLHEIEFADSDVMSGRNHIRQLCSRLNSLRREYQKKQRERSIAEAEAAWRRSWFEED